MANYFKSVLILSMVAVLFSCCKTNGTKPDYDIYSYTTNIVNPPDYFHVNYVVSFVGNKTANITFEANSVWAIKKLGDVRVLYTISNGTDNMNIESTDTIAFEGNKTYQFTANNFSSLDISNYLVEFSKVDTDYESFEPKF